jgi:hypothetical protein
MRASLCICCGLAVLLTGCKRPTATLAQFAENTRSSTERMAVLSEQENEQRERNSVPDIADIRNPPPVALVERYETRQGPDGLFVYDTETHSVAQVAGQPQAGLKPKQAEDAIDALEALDAKGAEH